MVQEATGQLTTYQFSEPAMALIPAGQFLMGSDPKRDRDAMDEELPQHTLYLPDHHLTKTPVPNARYAVCAWAKR